MLINMEKQSETIFNMLPPKNIRVCVYSVQEERTFAEKNVKENEKNTHAV